LTAYVLLQVCAGKAGSVVGWLRKLDGVEEAYAIYGEHDVIAKVEVPDSPGLDSLIVEAIQGNPNVLATTTLIAMESYPRVRRRRATRRRPTRLATRAGAEAPKRRGRPRRAKPAVSPAEGPSEASPAVPAA
jgi:DNA-binding Lrp family transcriptional regulator